MHLISETWWQVKFYFNYLMWFLAWDDFVKYSCCEGYKTRKIVYKIFIKNFLSKET